MASYNLQQQAFTLSMMSGGDTGQQGTPAKLESDLAASIDAKFQNPALISLIGNWTRVWGPVVWQDTSEVPPSKVADNTMFVAYNSDENVYVVAVAGTNFVSKYDWLTEDFSVKKLVSWNGPGQISLGTQDGLNALLAMTNEHNQTLSQYLQTIQEWATAQLIFTGHSLGGALAPTLALAVLSDLITPRWIDGVWSTGWPLSHIFISPTAGPTPGDQEFANSIAATFPAGAQGLNQLVWNTVDLVPHAWSSATFTETIMQGLYAPNIIASSCIQSLSAILTVLEDPLAQDYIQLPNSPFTAAYKEPSSKITDQTCAYIAQMLYQHTVEYYNQLAPELLTNEIFAPFDPLGSGEEIFVNFLYPKLLAALQQQGICTNGSAPVV